MPQKDPSHCERLQVRLNPRTNIPNFLTNVCRERNVRFRDIEFDLEEDKERCLHGLETSEDDRHSPSDVLRVTQVFEKVGLFSFPRDRILIL